jgi:membrane protease YdiL (CAAX protease family)
MQEIVQAWLGALSLALLVGSGLVWAAVVRRLVAGKPPVEFERRYPAPWSGLDVVVLALGIVFFEVVAAAFVGGTAGEPSHGISAASLAAQSAARLAWLVFALAYLVAARGAYLDDLGFDTSRLRFDARLGGLAFLAALVPVFAVQWFFVFVLDMPSKHPLVVTVEGHPSVATMVLATFLAVVVAPLFEEFVFRVLLQGWLENQQVQIRERRAGGGDQKPGFAPIVIASVVFAGMHMGYGPDPFALFVLSLVLGYVYRQTHRIFPSLVLHACVNGWAMLSLWLTV